VARRHQKWLFALTISVAPAASVLADPLSPDVIKLDEERLEPGLYPAAPGSDAYTPTEPFHPPLQIDWSLGLKGTYTSSSTTGGSFATTLHPQFSAVHEGVRADFTANGSAEISKSWREEGPLEVPSLRLGLEASTLLGPNTRLHSEGALAVNRELLSAPGLDPDIIETPISVTGSAGIGLEQTFGRFNVRVDGDVARTLYGDTNRRDTGITPNTSRNVWEAGATLRLGYQVTPIFEVFGEAGTSRDMFDIASPGLGVKTDATGRTLRGGITGNWDDRILATASIGVGQHDFDAAGLPDITTQLYDASVTYRPNKTVDVTAKLATNIVPAETDNAGTAKVEHTASIGVGYTVNSWLRLRGSADWSHSSLEGTSETEHRNGFGAGADYVLNANTALSVDYAFDHRDNSNSGVTDTHRVSLGVTLRR
jgi:hypothetical protein